MMPASVDLRPLVNEVPPVDQLQYGTCTTFGMLEAQEIQYERKGLVIPKLSHAYLYNWEQILEGILGQEGVKLISDTAKIMQTRGCCLESSYPYVATNLGVQPPASLDAEAAQYKIVSSDYTFNTKRCIARGKPVAICFQVMQDFMNAWNTIRDWRKFEWRYETALDNPFVGGHCVVIIGYDDAVVNADGTLGKWLVQNSWGPNGGDGGFFGIPYSYFSGSKWGQTQVPDAGVGFVNAGWTPEQLDFDALINWAESQPLYGLPAGKVTQATPQYFYRQYSPTLYVGLDIARLMIVVFDGAKFTDLGTLDYWNAQAGLQ